MRRDDQIDRWDRGLRLEPGGRVGCDRYAAFDGRIEEAHPGPLGGRVSDEAVELLADPITEYPARCASPPNQASSPTNSWVNFVARWVLDN